MPLPAWVRRCEVYAICMVWPIATIFCLVGTYRIFMWSYGGRECFRYVAIQEPFKEEWFQANPKSAIGMDTPLAHVPKYLDTPGYAVANGKAEHPHHRNY